MVLMCIYLPFLGARKYSSFSTEGLTKGPTEGLAEGLYTIAFPRR